PYLIKLAAGGDYTVQKGAIWALGEIGANESEDILRRATHHEDPEIQEAAIEAYNKLRSTNVAY
ncbi:MAG: HEAT repeat domain-containing protein, partial [Nitrospirota bacterium]